MQFLDDMATDTSASQINEFIERYTPEIARTFKGSRRKMRAIVPRGYELVYDNYNALAIGYGPGEKASDAIVSIVAYPRWVTLFFLYGSGLKDPDSLLEGSGSRVRSIRLRSADDLDRRAIKQLIAQALAPHNEALANCSRIKAIVKSISKTRRPRRP
ncbi:MAG TPA: DUF1801 domain-containing protein [Steroidobacteraceae bacterium]|nr:DUF1801 domain-containing protein [Steroidobacteraceae bacterium]